MGGKSKTKSKTENSQRQISLDAKDNKGIAVAAGGNVTVNALDGGAIEDAFRFAKDAQSNANEFAGKAQADAFRLVEKSQDTAFEFASDAQNKSYSLLAEGISEAFDTAEDALEYTSNAYNSMLEKNRTESAQSLDKLTKYFFSTVVLLGLAFVLRV